MPIEFNRAALERARTGFTVLFLAQLAAFKPYWERYATRIDSEDDKETLILPDGVGEMYDRDGSAPKRVSITRTYDITNKDKVNWLEIPRRAFERDKLQTYHTQVQLMGQTAASYGDKILMDLALAGFTDVGPDGVAFFSASHPIDGTTQSNLQSGALDATTFEAALTKLQSMTDYYGRPLELFRSGTKPKLIVGPSKRAAAVSIVAVQADAAGAGNPNFGQAEVEVNARLIGAYAGYWFLVYDDLLIKPFALSIAREPELHLVTDPEDKDVRDRNVVPAWVEASLGGGYAYYHLIVGSTG